MNAPISLARAHFPVTTLGPGRRLGIWFQGCSIRCPGCISTDTWAHRPPDRTVEEVLDALEAWAASADGITISGGEPFEQPVALAELLAGLKARTQADVLVYTGFAKSDIELELQSMEGLIDVLISEPYQIEIDQTLSLRGSDNQSLWCLTELGRMRFEDHDRPVGVEERTLDIGVDANGDVWMAGIPQRGDLERLAQVMRVAGHVVKTSEDRSWRRR